MTIQNPNDPNNPKDPKNSPAKKPDDMMSRLKPLAVPAIVGAGIALVAGGPLLIGAAIGTVAGWFARKQA